MRRALAAVAAVIYGIRDGWRQADYLHTSRNVEHLSEFGRTDEVYNWQDGGINIGQLLRAGRKSQAWRENYWPVSIIRK